MNCFKIKPVTIYGAKCLGKVTLIVLPTISFRYNPEEKSKKVPILKMKPNRINASFSVQVLS